MQKYVDKKVHVLQLSNWTNELSNCFYTSLDLFSNSAFVTIDLSSYSIYRL